MTAPGSAREGGTVLEARDLSVGHGSRAVVEGIGLSLRRGEALGIVGPNGSGKSTFLRTVLGLLPPLAGSLSRAPGFRAGYVPQTDAIDPVLPFRALDVARMAARADAALPFTASRDRERLAREALERVGVGHAFELPRFRDDQRRHRAQRGEQRRDHRLQPRRQRQAVDSRGHRGTAATWQPQAFLPQDRPELRNETAAQTHQVPANAEPLSHGPLRT